MAEGKPEHETLREWMQQRFDRIDDKLERETTSLNEEIIKTRHGIKPLIEHLAIQIAENVVETKDNTRRISQINDWRGDGGPLDKRFGKVNDRVDEERAWRHTMKGALIAASLFVPIVTGTVVAIVVKAVVG